MNLAPDWAALREAALAAASRSYAPYSGFAVGCAALVDDGRVISGCNVENASYGVTLCAECTMIGQLHLGGGGKLVAFDCVAVAAAVAVAVVGVGAGSGSGPAADPEPAADPVPAVPAPPAAAVARTVTPCGRCRQLLYEAAAPEMLVNTPAGILTIDELLPQAFGPAELK
jgi:cytidine deaminase